LGPTGTSVLLVHLLARDGASAACARRPDGSSIDIAAPTLDDRDSPVGRVADVLRRVLGLPTAPPSTSPDELWARLWLDRVLEEVGADRRRHWSWPSVAVLHPAARLVLDDVGGDLFDVAESMPRLAEILARSRSWSDLRHGYVAGQWDAPAVPAEIAAWMDDGIFSRWLLDGVPVCGATLLALRDLLPAGVTDQIERLLRRWEVPIDIEGDPWLPASNPSAAEPTSPDTRRPGPSRPDGPHRRRRGRRPSDPTAP
jgi:hypothetical protein